MKRKTRCTGRIKRRNKNNRAFRATALVPNFRDIGELTEHGRAKMPTGSRNEEGSDGNTLAKRGHARVWTSGPPKGSPTDQALEGTGVLAGVPTRVPAGVLAPLVAFVSSKPQTGQAALWANQALAHSTCMA